MIFDGQGLAFVVGPIEAKGRPFVRVRLPRGGAIMVPAKKASRLLRRPVSKPEAEKLLAILGDPTCTVDKRHSALRFRDAQRTLTKGSLEDLVRMLQQLYCRPFQPAFGDRKLIATLEDVVLSELAWSLSGAKDEPTAQAKREALEAQLHASSRVFSPAAPATPKEAPLTRMVPPDPFGFATLKYLGSFQVTGGQLVVGDPAYVDDEEPELESGCKAKGRLLAQAWDGEWHAYVRRSDDVPGTLIALHGPHARELGAQEATPKEARQPLGRFRENGHRRWGVAGKGRGPRCTAVPALR
ncbi:MAG: hypothetical protein QM765_08225 [Myxococcales bacterium]